MANLNLYAKVGLVVLTGLAYSTEAAVLNQILINAEKKHQSLIQ